MIQCPLNECGGMAAIVNPNKYVPSYGSQPSIDEYECLKCGHVFQSSARLEGHNCKDDFDLTLVQIKPQYGASSPPIKMYQCNICEKEPIILD